MSERRPFRGGGRSLRGGFPNGARAFQQPHDSSNDAVPQTRRAPSHLRGKEIGLWYRDEHRRSVSAKGARKAPTTYYRIRFVHKLVKAIRYYLDAAKADKDELPLSEYCKRLKITHVKHRDSGKGASTSSGIVTHRDSGEEASTSSGIDASQADFKVAEASIGTFLPSSPSCSTSQSTDVVVKEEPASESSDSESGNSELDVKPVKRPLIEFLNDDRTAGWSNSIDKYGHLEDSPFKQRFLSLLSSNIQERLQYAVHEESVYSTRIEELDEKLRHEFLIKEESAPYQRMMEKRKQLPAFQAQNAIVKSIEQNQVLLISGETGCGKTTQVAQFILDEAIRNGNGSLCNVICTQPRRISAVSVAQRVSHERIETVGHNSVGYQIRLEKRVGRDRGSILFCTTGIVLQLMQGDPALFKYSHVILDEIHERDTLCDFTMTILKDIAAKRRNLKIILMSATLNAERFSTYFGDCPRINIPGFTYPVQEFYLEDVLLATNYQLAETKEQMERRMRKIKPTDPETDFEKYIVPYAKTLRGKYPDFVVDGLLNPRSERMNVDLTVDLIKHICVTREAGAILVFAPGWDAINSIVRRMNDDEDNFFRPSLYCIIPLHSLLPTSTQLNVFNHPPRGQRKIVIATNIAETSITIDDVVYVVDCGQMKVKNYDVDADISTLKSEFVSLANARQRRGRAGRVQSGICYHLFSRERERILADYPLPEMLRTRLEQVVLNIKVLQLGNAASFLEKVMDPPNPQAVSLAIKLLMEMNALDENENLTPLGFHLARLPVEPQIGKMLLMAVTMNCLNPILSIAAALSFRDPFQTPLDQEHLVQERKLILDRDYRSDHLIFAEVMDRWDELAERDRRRFCRLNYLSESIMRQLDKQKALFAQYLVDLGFLMEPDYKNVDLNVNSERVLLLKAVICSGLYPNVIMIKRQKSSRRGHLLLVLRTSEDGSVNLHQKSVNTAQQTNFRDLFFVYHEKLLSTDIFIHDATMISALPLLMFGNNLSVTYRYAPARVAIIELNKDLRFECNHQTARYITEMNARIHHLVEYKLSHPHQAFNTSGMKLFRTVTDLFSFEKDMVIEVMFE